MHVCGNWMHDLPLVALVLLMWASYVRFLWRANVAAWHRLRAAIERWSKPPDGQA